MSVFSKNIAVIKTLRQGFSANGGELSGIVKCEKYATRLKVEISFINFAPLSEGRLVCAISDGQSTVFVENGEFEGESEINTANGFCAMICFVHKGVLPIAAAVCGNFAKHLALLPKIIAEEEKILQSKTQPSAIFEKDDIKDTKNTQNEPYDDEAIAEDDYYEYGKTIKERSAFKQSKTQKEGGDEPCKNEEDASPFKEESKKLNKAFVIGSAERGQKRSSGDILGVISPLAEGKSFYEEVKEEVERVLCSFPKEENLCNVVSNSRWVKINYGDKKFYVFGVIYRDGAPEYLCYGVPATNSQKPPKSLNGLATFIPAVRDAVTSKGYWVTYQSALTGASIKITQA